jgi:hypothetical protein
MTTPGPLFSAAYRGRALSRSFLDAVIDILDPDDVVLAEI